MEIRDPGDFELGVATSSWQIEGDIAGRGRCTWDDFSETPGRVIDGATGAVACDHVNRLEEDLDLLAWLGVDAYRFSISWPRVMPGGTGSLSSSGLEFYDRLVDGLLARGITPVATLYHWDLPSELEAEGGWVNRETAHRFAEYSEAMARHFAGRIGRWATLNEPWCTAFLGYCSGYFAPGRTEPGASLEAAYNLILGHGLAVERMRAAGATDIGIVLNLIPIVAETPSMEAAAAHADGLQNRIFLDLLAGRGVSNEVRASCASITDWSFVHDSDNVTLGTPIDWLGVNYYTVMRVAEPKSTEAASVGQDTAHIPACPPMSFAPRGELTQMGWEIYPEGIVDALRIAERGLPGVPLWICENGVAVDDFADDAGVHDPIRTKYLADHINAVLDARRAGMDVRGYFAWSLMDNLEWSSGWTMQFGIVRVDPATCERTPKDSAHWYRSQLLGRKT